MSVHSGEGNTVFKLRFRVILKHYEFCWGIILQRTGSDVKFAFRVCVCIVFTQSNHTTEKKTPHFFLFCFNIFIGKGTKVLRIGTVASTCKCGRETSASIKC